MPPYTDIEIVVWNVYWLTRYPSIVIITFHLHIPGVQEKKTVSFGQFISNLITLGSDLFVPRFGLGGTRIRKAFLLWDYFWASSLDLMVLGIASLSYSEHCPSHFMYRTAFFQ